MGKPFLGYERIGEQRINSQGYLMTIIKYNHARDIEVLFSNDNSTKKTSYYNFKNGITVNENVTNIRLEEERINSQGSKMKIIEYHSSDNIIVQFESGYKTRTQYREFNEGKVRDKEYPSRFGVGIVGNINYIDDDGKEIKEFSEWNAMLSRCFYKPEKMKHPTYKDVTCCDEWLYFPNFYNWCHTQENWNKVLESNVNFNLDKDIIIKGNKLYSPNTCCFVPHNVNKLFTKTNAKRGEYPIGVTYDKRNKKYVSACTNPYNNKRTSHYCDTPVETWYLYKIDKESFIKTVAEEEYINKNITKECYEAMMNYEVEITD